MEAPNIQLYNLFRNDLHLNDGKSLELMNLLDKEYKSGVREDLNILDKKVDDRIDALDKKMDARFAKIDDRLSAHDKRFDALDFKIDLRSLELNKAISDSRVEITHWMIGIILVLIGLIIANLLKK